MFHLFLGKPTFANPSKPDPTWEYSEKPVYIHEREKDVTDMLEDVMSRLERIEQLLTEKSK